MPHINSLEILNLPHEKTNWDIWDRIDLEWWKNLLLTGNKGTGKTTMLQILHDSLERARNIVNGKHFWQYKNVVDLFFQISNSLKDDPVFWTWGNVNLNLWFNNFLVRESWSSQIDDWIDECSDVDIDDEVYRTMAILLRHIFWNGIEQFIDPSFSCTKGQLESKLCEVFYDSQIDELSSRDKEEISVWIMSEFIARWARVYGERYNIPEEVMYGNLLFLALEIHPGQSDGGSKWGYIRSRWKDGFLNTPKLSFFHTEDDENKSSGENQDERMKQVQNVDSENPDGAIVFFDEPMAHQDRPSKKALRTQIIDTQWKIQWIVAEHDEMFIDQAEEHDNWVVHDLCKKK